jgi:hypothetical protein
MASDDGFTLYDAAGAFGEQIADYGIATMTAKAAGKRLMSGRWNGAEFYVDGGSPTRRPMLWPFDAVALPADGVTALAIENIPAGTRIRFGRNPDGWQSIDDGFFEFVTAHADEVGIEFNPPFPWRPQTITVVSHAV